MQALKWNPTEPVHIWCCRHGESEFNVQNRIGGNPAITAAGRHFAAALPALFGHALKAAEQDPRFITVWTSTLRRTVETAAQLPLPQVRRLLI